jgi:hypothetical protein
MTDRDDDLRIQVFHLTGKLIKRSLRLGPQARLTVDKVDIHGARDLL